MWHKKIANNVISVTGAAVSAPKRWGDIVGLVVIGGIDLKETILIYMNMSILILLIPGFSREPYRDHHG